MMSMKRPDHQGLFVGKISKLMKGKISFTAREDIHKGDVLQIRISPEEKEVFFWLKENYPELKLISTVRPEMRVRTRQQSEKILAIGQKAAWFTGSRNFVNMVQGGGLWGFDGIRHTAQLMVEAFHEEKDPEDLIVRKGWGCESCI